MLSFFRSRYKSTSYLGKSQSLSGVTLSDSLARFASFLRCSYSINLRIMEHGSCQPLSPHYPSNKLPRYCKVKREPFEGKRNVPVPELVPPDKPLQICTTSRGGCRGPHVVSVTPKKRGGICCWLGCILISYNLTLYRLAKFQSSQRKWLSSWPTVKESN